MKKQAKKSQVKRLEISEVNELITKVKQTEFEEEKLKLLFKDEMDIYAFILGVTKLAEDEHFEEQKKLWAIVDEVITTIGVYHLGGAYLEYEDILEVFDVLARGRWYVNTECWLIETMLQVRHNDNLSNDNILEIFNKIAHLINVTSKKEIIKSLFLTMKHYINYLTFNNVNKNILKYTLKTMASAMSNKTCVDYDDEELFTHTVLRQYLNLLADIFRYHCKLNKIFVKDGIIDVSTAVKTFEDYDDDNLPHLANISTLEIINRMLTLDELQDIFNDAFILTNLYELTTIRLANEYLYPLQHYIILRKFDIE